MVVPLHCSVKQLVCMSLFYFPLCLTPLLIPKLWATQHRGPCHSHLYLAQGLPHRCSVRFCWMDEHTSTLWKVVWWKTRRGSLCKVLLCRTLTHTNPGKWTQLWGRVTEYMRLGPTGGSLRQQTLSRDVCELSCQEYLKGSNAVIAVILMPSTEPGMH
jgi:hypothetical protein